MLMLELTFITGNSKKFLQAQQALRSYPITLIQQKINLPEIQDQDCSVIAKFSARFAAQELKKPVVVTDAGYYIKALNGFPGPFIKFVNEWFTPEDILRLLNKKANRKVYSPICIAYCEPDQNPVSFISENWGSLAYKAEGTGSTIDQLYIPDGHKKPIGTLPEEQRIELWNTECWKKLAEYLTEKNNALLTKNYGR